MTKKARRRVKDKAALTENSLNSTRASNTTRKIASIHQADGIDSPFNATQDEAHRPSAPHKTKALPNATAEILGGFNATNVTANPYQDPMYVASHLFHNGRVEPDPNATYGATIGLIVLLHVVFFLHWNSRKTRRDVLVSYHELMRKKQFHKSVVAVVSHPPADPLTLRERSNLAIDMGDSNHHVENSGRLGRIRRCCMDYLQPISFGHLSGFPLLAYNSHLLWACRALEALCPTPWCYVRFLIALTAVALLLELRITSNLLQSNVMVSNVSLSGIRSTLNGEHHRALLHRTMGTPTMLTAALLFVYHAAFRHVAIPILPFLPVSRRMDVGLSYFLCFMLLTALSWKSHPVMSVMCGTMSGLFWVAGLTSFLGDAYWGTVMLAWILFGCLLSLRASPQLAGWVPFIDHVAWDSRGRFQYDGLSLGPQQEEQQEATPPIEDDVESQPLLSRRSDSTGLRGRVPMMDMDDEMEVPPSSDTLTTPARGLSQRRSGLESFHHRYE